MPGHRQFEMSMGFFCGGSLAVFASTARMRRGESSMQVKLFVGNLPWSVGDAELSQIFTDHGAVHSARVISDRDTGRSRGFGFVEMDTDDVGALIRATDGYAIEGRNLRVNLAEDKPAPRRGSDRGGFGGRRDRY